jgi:hypothetical protein
MDAGENTFLRAAIELVLQLEFDDGTQNARMGLIPSSDYRRYRQNEPTFVFPSPFQSPTTGVSPEFAPSVMRRSGPGSPQM